MSCRTSGAGLVGAAVVAALAGTSCAVRVGPGGPPPDDTSTPFGASACSRLNEEKALSFGKGAESFAFLWDTDHYVVVYSDPSTGDGDIYVARMAADGATIGAPVVVQSTPAQSDLPSLLETSTGYLVVWQEGSAGKAVYAHALTPDAEPTGPGVAVAPTQSAQARPVLARAPGGKAAVTWMDTFDGKPGVSIALVDPATLAITGPQRIAPSDVDGWPWVAGDDRSLAMVWSDKTSGPYDIQFATIDPTDPTLAPQHQTPLRDDARHDALLPRMIRTSFGYMAAWEDVSDSDNQIHMALVDAQGDRLGGGVVEEPNSGDANWPNLAWNGSAAGIVYYQWRSGRPQIYMSFVDGTGARVAGLHDLQVSSGKSGWSKYPDVVWTGTEFGVLFVDTRNGAPALWLQRVSCAG
jgi:hypothetical protein